MKFVYICTAGASDPTRASLPVHLAVNGTVEAGHEARIVLVGDATDLVVGETADSLQGVGVPPMKELLDKARQHGVPVDV